jgi:hypothetical protein
MPLSCLLGFSVTCFSNFFARLYGSDVILHLFLASAHLTYVGFYFALASVYFFVSIFLQIMQLVHKSQS